MSLSALRIIADISDPQKQTLLQSFFSQRPAGQGVNFLGDVNALEFYPVTANPSGNTPYWLPADLDASKLRLAIGDVGAVSTAGTVALNYDGNGDGLSAISVSVSAASLQTALNANPAVDATGDTVTVTLLSAGTYKLAWSGVGAKELVQGEADNATPESVVVADWLVEGDASTKAVQLLRFLARPFSLVDDWTELSGAVATVTELRAGSESAKAMFAVSISPVPYSGSFSIKTSGALAVGGSETEWQSAMGNGWVVLKTGDASLTIERAAAGVYTLASGDVDVAGLSCYIGYRGILNFSKTALFERFASETGESFSTSMHIRHDDSEIETLNFSDITLHASLLSSGSLSPSNWDGGFYTKAEMDTLLLSLRRQSAVTVSTAGNTELAKAASKEIQSTYRITAGAGAGSYTRTLSLSTASCANGDKAFVTIQLAGSLNPTVEIHNATSAGTLLYTVGGTGSALTVTASFTFNGTAWESDQ